MGKDLPDYYFLLSPMMISISARHNPEYISQKKKNLEKRFSNFNVQTSQLRILLKCRL